MGFVYQTPETVGGTVLIIERIESQNYVAGVAGWAIEADGDAEFNNVTVRGNLITGPPTVSHWEIKSSPANEIQGHPADNVNNPDYGQLSIDSIPIGVNLWLYETRLTSPRSSLTPTASTNNPLLRLVAHEATGDTSAELRGDIGLVGDSGSAVYMLWDSATPDLSLHAGAADIEMDNTGTKITGGTTLGAAGSKVNTMRHGNASGVTNAASQLIIPHGLGSAPSAVMLGPQSHYARIQAVGVANITVEFRNPAGGALVPATNCSTYWLAIA